MRKIIINCDLSASEVVMLTGAIRDLHGCYPGRFATDIRTSFPELWLHNPNQTKLNGAGETIECESPPTRRHNGFSQHAVQGFVNIFNQKLGLEIRPTTLKGDIHLSEEEKNWSSQTCEIIGEEVPFWILVAGDSEDGSVQRWEKRKFQRVVDNFKGRIQFVQVGTAAHPTIKGVIDLREKVDPRQLIRLFYHSQGVVCLNTVHAHLAAAIQTKFTLFQNRPCIVVAGGQQSVFWGSYPHHQYIHTIGALPCCVQEGCWKTHSVVTNRRRPLPTRNHLCVDVIKNLPRCMKMIEADDVIQRIEIYLRSNVLPKITAKQADAATMALEVGKRTRWNNDKLEAVSFRKASEDFIKGIPLYPRKFKNRGIVICAGGHYLPCAWVCIRMLRKLGCRLPVELWHLGKKELDASFQRLLKHYDVRCIDALEIKKRHPARELMGWPLKAYAMKHTRFEEVLLLDADNVPVENPEFLFETPEYKNTGAIFWPDIRRGVEPAVWKIFGVPYVKEPEFESGQIVLNKRKCWHALCLSLWFNEHGDFYYRHILGDKDTFHLAFRKLKKSFSLVPIPVELLIGTMCQHDFNGRRIFQHRNQRKWRLTATNEIVPGFLYEEECQKFLDDLRLKWLRPPLQSVRNSSSQPGSAEARFHEELTGNFYEYNRLGFDSRRMSFRADGTIDLGKTSLEKYWQLTHLDDQIWLELFSDDKVICRLTPTASGNWAGRWNYFEKMPVKLNLESNAAGGYSLKNPSHSKKRRILFRAPLNGYTGYGLHANQIVTDLQEMGYEFYIRAIDINETFAPIPLNVRKAISCQEYSSDWELVLFPPGWAPVNGRKTVQFTMWESTKLHSSVIGNLNRCESVIVPTQWNASCFASSGVERPIHIVPLGIKTDIFKFAPMDVNGPCVFGTAGRLESGGTRKGIGLVIKAFKTAFPHQKDVRLYVKIFPDCEIPFESDQRIKFNREYFSETQMAAWYQSLTCFVSAARGEGWGLMQHQALATGRPIISVRFGGTAEFFDQTMGYPLDFKLVPAEDLYTGCGLWADPDEKHLVHEMRQVYRDRNQAQKRGLCASNAVSHLSWAASNKKLSETLRKVGMVD